MDGLDNIWIKSDDMVERRIEDSIIIVPLTSGGLDEENELFSLDKLGEEIWNRIDGKRRVGEVVDEISVSYDVKREVLVKDILGFLEEVNKRKLIVKSSSSR